MIMASRRSILRTISGNWLRSDLSFSIFAWTAAAPVLGPQARWVSVGSESSFARLDGRDARRSKMSGRQFPEPRRHRRPRIFIFQMQLDQRSEAETQACGVGLRECAAQELVQ